MRVESRGVGWDRGKRARLYSRFGRGVALFGLLVALLPDAPGFGLLLALLGSLFMLLGFVTGVETPQELPGFVDVDAHGRVVATRAGKASVAFPREQLAGAWLVRRVINLREYYWVEISTTVDTTVSVRVSSPEEGRALVEALGFGTIGRAVKIPLAKRSRRVFHLLLVAVAYVAATMTSALAHWPATMLFTFAALYALLRFAFRPPVLEVGSDALHVTTGFRKLRIPRGDIASVASFAPASLIIERKNGKKLRVLPLALDPARVDAAAEVIDARLGDRPAPPRAAAFERGGRALPEWRAGLRTAVDPSYRAAAASIEDAAAVLDSPSATTEQRIGAALALRVAGEPLDRVRIAAEGTVDPKVRVVLDAISEGADDARLEETLRALER